jgi:ABC-type molybdate transport system substrate-binding protein
MRLAALRNLLGTGLLILCTLALPVRAADAPDQELLLFAAASLTNALDEIGAAFTQKTQQHVKCSYAASSALAKQIGLGRKPAEAPEPEPVPVAPEPVRRSVVGRRLPKAAARAAR